MVHDVAEVDFQQQVLERSSEVPVVVDFWAEWCGPCRTLGPALEQAVASRDGRVDLAKVDVDSNQQLASAYRVQGIPAVKAFRDGEVIAEFTGAVPPAQIEAFLDRILPSAAEELGRKAEAEGDEAGLREALEMEPGNKPAILALTRLLLGRGDTAEALELAEPLAGTDFELAGLAARARLAQGDDSPDEAFAAWDSGDHDRALELLQSEVEGAEPDRRELLRQVMVGCFTELGPASETAAAHRRRLAALLS
ncbi:MAG: thioredoxin domain-containing protein [Actinomycetota bacterium]|nr:thioredoxin domain-containing protein [Actinomycetota bacterium]